MDTKELPATERSNRLGRITGYYQGIMAAKGFVLRELKAGNDIKLSEFTLKFMHELDAAAAEYEKINND